MNFPQTRQTLIQRIAATGAEDDWREFMIDYWRPVCRFAARWGKIGVDDAEDVAAITFQALISGDLLSRWSQNRSAKLRTLLCTIVRNVLSNRARVSSGRQRLLEENREAILELASVQSIDGSEASMASNEQVDAFYSAWVDELLQDTAESLLEDYLREGRGDYFRVLYGRICERMTVPEIANSLGLATTMIENYYRHAKQRFGKSLKRLLDERLRRHSPPERFSAEFQAEWDDLSDFLSRRGGIEKALSESYQSFDSSEIRRHEVNAVTTFLKRISPTLRPEGPPGPRPR